VQLCSKLVVGLSTCIYLTAVMLVYSMLCCFLAEKCKIWLFEPVTDLDKVDINLLTYLHQSLVLWQSMHVFPHSLVCTVAKIHVVSRGMELFFTWSVVENVVNLFVWTVWSLAKIHCVLVFSEACASSPIVKLPNNITYSLLQLNTFNSKVLKHTSFIVALF